MRTGGSGQAGPGVRWSAATAVRRPPCRRPSPQVRETIERAVDKLAAETPDAHLHGEDGIDYVHRVALELSNEHGTRQQYVAYCNATLDRLNAWSTRLEGQVSCRARRTATRPTGGLPRGGLPRGHAADCHAAFWRILSAGGASDCVVLLRLGRRARHRRQAPPGQRGVGHVAGLRRGRGVRDV